MMDLFEFAHQMSEELRKNNHKSGWSLMSNAQLLNRLRQELRELELALKRKSFPAQIVSEAADVANFAYFIADNNSLE